MKKLLFFKSSAIGNGHNKTSLPPSADKQIYWENPSEHRLKGQTFEVAENSLGKSPKGSLSITQKQIPDIQKSNESPALRRSRSMSSAAFSGIEPGQAELSTTRDQGKSPSSSTCGFSRQHYDHSFRSRALTPERHRPRCSEVPAIHNPNDSEGCDNRYSSMQFDSSGSSSSSSSNVSSSILDRYIVGEQQEEMNKPKNDLSERNSAGTRNIGGRLPPGIHCTSPNSPTDSAKVRAISFRAAKNSHMHFSSRDCVESGFRHESPRRLAKNVIERLSQSRVNQKTSHREIDLYMPVTLEDIYGGSLNECFESQPDMVAQKSYSSDEPFEAINKNHGEDYACLQKQFREDYGEGSNLNEIVDGVDVELQRRLKEAKERILLLSEEQGQECFMRKSDFNVQALLQTIRSLTEEKMSLALEVSSLLQSQIAERTSAKEELKLAKVELDFHTRRLEKEKNELQSALERELDRRSSEWSTKLEKYQYEEQRLRDRVRELAEKNVSLQREVTSFNERETESRSTIIHYEQQLRDISTRVKDMSDENQDLQKNMSEFQEKYIEAEEDRLCLQKNFEEKEKECKELCKSITRLLRTCSEQERTIDGLQEAFSKELENDQWKEKFDKHVAKLQMEQIRLIGVEQALRRELESSKIEVDSLRHENISLFNRLKGNGKESDALTMKLDTVMWNRIYCLKNQGLAMLNECLKLCSNLLRLVKEKRDQFLEPTEEIEGMKHGLDVQLLVESEMKVQGLKRGIENLTRSLQMMSDLLDDKSNLVASKYGSRCMDANESTKSNNLTGLDETKYELKAETLLTTLLREKMYSKELEVEQLQAELATAVRVNDTLRCELQKAMDNLSCNNHKLKDLELQILKKDENINRLEDDLHKSMKELKAVKGILPEVSKERDLMWEEVKQYNEKNMQLNSEVNMLKRKIETLDEEMLLKEGQITILKDTLGNKSFNLLASSDSSREFLL